MVQLFVSERIFIDGSFYNGGITVNNEGKIDEIFKHREQVNEWLKSTMEKGNVVVNDEKICTKTEQRSLINLYSALLIRNDPLNRYTTTQIW